jgi:hypothetical protein
MNILEIVCLASLRKRTSSEGAIDGYAGWWPNAATGREIVKILKSEPTVDILLNNLGIYQSNRCGLAEVFRHQCDERRAAGAWVTCPAMLKQNWGRIVFISSEAGIVIPGDMIDYGHDEERAALVFALACKSHPGYARDRQCRDAGPDTLGRHYQIPAQRW